MEINQTLQRILETRTVSDGATEYKLGAEIPRGEGEFICDLITRNRPRKTLEIGCAFGISSLFICDALRRTESDFVHIIIDPFQHEDWHGIGVGNLEKAGFSGRYHLIEKRSEIALPELLDSGEKFDFAFIDGWHTFDQTLVDFFYLNKMLNTNGLIVFDDAKWRSVRRVVRHALTYPCYRLAGYWPKKLSNRLVLNPVGRARCVAIRKVLDDNRGQHWYVRF